MKRLIPFLLIAMFSLASSAAPVEIQITNSPYARTWGTIPVKVYLYTNDPIDSFDTYNIGLVYDGQEYVETVTGMTVSRYRDQYYVLNNTLPLEKNGSKEFKVWVQCRGQRYETPYFTVRSYPFKAVFEEVTATWCAWCVRGIVALDDLRNNYADKAIGMAVHYYSDVMGIADYYNALGAINAIGGIPTGYLNRWQRSDPSNFKTYLNSLASAEPVVCCIDLTAQKDASVSGQYIAYTKVRFADDIESCNYRLAYVVLENNVHVDNYLYNQSNAYSGGSPMGGFESKPSTILAKDMWYNDVVRGNIGSFNGFPGSIPASITAEETINHNIRFTLPSNVLVADNTELVVMLIDQKDGHIINAEKVSLNIDNSSTEVSSVDQSAKVRARYSLSGTPLPFDAKGLQIVVMEDGSVKKVYVK